jgi:DNA-binding CsgD family transcriptional regulator
MFGPDTEQFAAQLAEWAQASHDLRHLRRCVLERLRTFIACETVFWGAYPCAPADGACFYATPDDRARRALDAFVQGRARYDVPNTLWGVREASGLGIDEHIFAPRKHDCQLLYTEILRPAGIRTYLACGIEFRGCLLSLITLSRHARDARFAAHEQELMGSIRGLLALAEAAFRATAGSAARSTAARLLAEYPLTPRESQVASMIARGMQNKEIANLLGTSPDTVRKHTIRVYEKLGVAGRVELVARVCDTPALGPMTRPSHSSASPTAGSGGHTPNGEWTSDRTGA